MKVNNNKNKKRRKTQIERKLMFPTLQYPVQNKFLKKKKYINTSENGGQQISDVCLQTENRLFC